jgi:hypothetical protein
LGLLEPENHSASNRFTRRQNNSQLQSQNKNYRRQDEFNKINRELKSKNKYSVNQTRTRQQNVVHRNETTYIGKNFPNHFLEQRVSNKAAGRPQNNIQNANQEHPRLIDSSKYLSFVGLGIQSDLLLTDGPPISSSSSSSFPLNI